MLGLSSAHINDSHRSLKGLTDPSMIQRLENHKVKGETNIRESEEKMQKREKAFSRTLEFPNKSTVWKVKVVIFSPSLVSLKSQERLPWI